MGKGIAAMNLLKATAFALGLLGLAGCVTPVGPVRVTRFHAADIGALGRGSISVEPAPGMDPNSLEWRSYQAAVLRQLVLLGYTEAAPGRGTQLAQLRYTRGTVQPERARSPVNVGLGGSTGTYGSGVGLGIGINLSPKPSAQVQTDLGVLIKDRARAETLWEGRASFIVRSTSPLADTALGSAKISEALFKGFPGQSGETIEVK